MKVSDRLIVALDTNDLGVAESIIGDLEGNVGPYKIGLEAINSGIAHELAQMVISAGGQVFWDGKFLDIPNTVAGAVKGLLKKIPSGIWAFNVHATGEIPMMRDAVSNRGAAQVLAVTVLTSLGERETRSLYGLSPTEAVITLSEKALGAEVQGLICSAQEANAIREDSRFNKLILVTPAIRPDWAVPADQARPTTPGQAILNGSDYIVVGRPITDPPKNSGHTRSSATEAILEEMTVAFEQIQVS